MDFGTFLLSYCTKTSSCLSCMSSILYFATKKNDHVQSTYTTITISFGVIFKHYIWIQLYDLPIFIPIRCVAHGARKQYIQHLLVQIKSSSCNKSIHKKNPEFKNYRDKITTEQKFQNCNNVQNCKISALKCNAPMPWIHLQ